MGIGNGHFFHADMVSLQWVPVSVYVCLDWKRFSQRNPILGKERCYLLGLITCEHRRM